MGNFIDLTGMTFGSLTVIDRADSDSRRVMWNCRCECGVSAIVRGESLRDANTTSCGCIGRKRLAEHRNKHGQAQTPTYFSWQYMKERCFSPTHKSFANYGGRGITVCERWLDFKKFFADMGPKPEGSYSIEREDVNGNYEPGNCRWATAKEQSNNKRSSVRIEFGGRTQTIGQWADELGMNYDTLYSRVVLYHWTVDRAILSAVQPGHARL